MANPRIFVSSTCYDLGEVRDSLYSFVKSFSFDPVLSERGDVFYHPDLHTHESCIREIENCQMFILIIGGRFGGNYIADTSRSIVNAEYISARECDKPVFCFIKREVYEDHRVYIKNKRNKSIVDKIVYPSIENQKHAIKIFEFIDEVRHAGANNGIFSFEFARDIQDVLRKQWAGMFYDFLTNRKYQRELETTTRLLDQLTLASQKTEEMIKNIYLKYDNDNLLKPIQEINYQIEARQFFERVLREFDLTKISSLDLNSLANVPETIKWYEFLVASGYFYYEPELVAEDTSGKEVCEDVLFLKGGPGIGIGGPSTSNKQKEKIKKIEELFKAYLKLNKDQRLTILEEFVIEEKE